MVRPMLPGRFAVPQNPAPASSRLTPEIQNRAAFQQKMIAAFNGQIQLVDGYGDVQPGAIYDAIEYEEGSALNTPGSMFFTNVEAGSGKTYVETNMYENRRLPAPEAFSISRIMFTFARSCDPRDVLDLSERLCFEFWYGQKCYQRHVLNSLQQRSEPGPLLRVCEYCHGVYVSREDCPGCGAREFRLPGVGEGSAQGYSCFLDLPYPLVIVNQMSFFAQFIMQPIILKHRLKIWCHLIGLHARGVM